MAVHFGDKVPRVLKNRTLLKRFILQTIENYGRKPGNIIFSFCNDEQMIQANITFLSHDFYTDILTFDLSDSATSVLSAEILISVETVQSNAIKFKTEFIQELHRVIFHGVLHLCGYKDKSKSDLERMRDAEESLLKKYALV